MKISINIPSYKRTYPLEILEYIHDAKIWVCETEVENYKKINRNINIIAVPKGIQGNLCRIRNYILDKENNDGADGVCLMDDDIKHIGYFEKNIAHKISSKHIRQWIEKCSDIAYQWGVKMWGVNCNSDPKSYREYTPFSTLSYIGGPFSVHLKSDLRYDENLPLKEDYDMTLQQIYKYRKVLRFNKYHYCNKMGASGTGNIGGCATYRNIIKEKEQLNLLKKKWGNDIVKNDSCNRSMKGKKVDDLNPIIRIPIKGV